MVGDTAVDGRHEGTNRKLMSSIASSKQRDWTGSGSWLEILKAHLQWCISSKKGVSAHYLPKQRHQPGSKCSDPWGYMTQLNILS